MFLAVLCALTGRDTLTVVIGCVAGALGVVWLSWQVRSEARRRRP